MDFHLTKEQLLVRKMYREFAENEVKPLAAEIDEEERFPMETVEKMAKLGMMGIYFPKEYGGAGGDVLSYAMCVEELAKVCGTTAVIVSAHTSLCCAPIFEHGTEAQKQKYLPDLLSGKKIGVQLGTTGDILADDVEGATVERYNKGFEAVQALSQGKIDAVIIDRQPAQVFVDENEGLKILDEAFAEEEYAIAIAKDNTELLDKVNAALGELKESCKLDEIIGKYISAE